MQYTSAPSNRNSIAYGLILYSGAKNGTYHYLGWYLGSQVLILTVVKKVPVPGG